MRREIIITICCIFVLFLCAVSKWQLALEEGEAGAQQDHLIGVFVTTEHLDLFDIDSYLADNAGSLREGNVEVEGNTEKYEGRLYATLKPITTTEEETFETEGYIFEGVPGIPFFYPDESLVSEQGDYTIPMSDEGISDVDINVNVNQVDDEDSITIEGVIYTSPSSAGSAYYINPVFQSADGSIYIVSGSGMSSESSSEGDSFSTSLDDVTTVTENGRSKKESFSITLAISVMLKPEKIVISQIDAENIPVDRTEYEPGKLPDSFEAQADAAYLVAETYKYSEDGELEISREIFDRDAEEIITFFGREDGVCVENRTPIEW